MIQTNTSVQCCKSKEENANLNRFFLLTSELIPVLISSFLLLLATAISHVSDNWLGTGKFVVVIVFLLPAYLISGWNVLVQAFRNALRGYFFDENFLMTIATIGAICLGEISEAVVVMLFFQIGELFQGYSIRRSRGAIQSLIEIRPQTASLFVGDSIEVVEPRMVSIGSKVLVRPGEKIPLDGEVIDGQSLLNTSLLTGESLPREVCVGDQVLAGSINQSAKLVVRVTKPFDESSISRIFELVEQASTKKAPTEKFITRFARIYTPIVVLIASFIAILPPLIASADPMQWLNRALVLLVISCPCGLVISIPLGYFGGIGAAAKHGILIKGSVYLDALCKVGSVVFDKTGTLTQGIFSISSIAPSEGFVTSDLLEVAAYAESFSNHPVAQSIQNAYQGTIDQSRVADLTEIPGLGIRARVNGQVVLAGNERLMDHESISHPISPLTGTVVHIAVDSRYAGLILIQDLLKPEASKTIRQLQGDRIHVSMLTGDNHHVANAISLQLGLDSFKSELLPEDKVLQLEKMMSVVNAKHKNVIYVGDGINDAPVIARADVGFAMGNLGSDVAIETADVVLMTDSLLKIPKIIEIARCTRRVVVQNISFALGIKLMFIFLAAFGVATLWEAVFADVGVALLAILNATRLIRS